MRSLGFIESVVMPSVYVHPEGDIEISIHVDDFLLVGAECDLKWAREEIAKTYTLKSCILGPGTDHTQEVKYLGRTIRWTAEGVEYEGNAKHVESLLESLGMTQCRGVNTPMTAEDLKGDKQGGKNKIQETPEQLNC